MFSRRFYLACLSYFLAASALAGSTNLHMISDLPAADSGTCLGLKRRAGSAEEITHERVSAVLQRLREMRVNGPRYLNPLQFSLVTSGRSNAFGGNRLALSMLCLDQFGNSRKCPVATGTVAHEIGHWVGRSMRVGRKSAYEAFRDSAFSACHGFDGYSTHFRDGRPHGNDLNETFAEVFAGYVTAPAYMQRACPAGYEFMRTKIFRGALSACGPAAAKAVVPLPRPRPPEADQAELPEPGDDAFIGPVLPSADGEHDVPLPRPRPPEADLR